MDAGYWYPFFPEVFRKATRHLTLEQEALYRRLIDEYMVTREPLPDNDVALARICGVPVECIEHAGSILRAFFEQRDGLLQHDYCNKILDEQDIRSKNRSQHASKAAQKRWSMVAENKRKNAPSMPGAMLGDATLTQTQTVEDVDGARARDDVFGKGEIIAEIVGWKDDPRWMGNYSRLGVWLEQGWDFNLDILPTVREVMAKKHGEPPRSLSYFERAIADAHERRLRPVVVGDGRVQAKRDPTLERMKIGAALAQRLDKEKENAE